MKLSIILALALAGCGAVQPVSFTPANVSASANAAVTNVHLNPNHLLFAAPGTPPKLVIVRGSASSDFGWGTCGQNVTWDATYHVGYIVFRVTPVAPVHRCRIRFNPANPTADGAWLIVTVKGP